ncbi:MAG: XRE family transcriptional regulator [Chloroflexota bacterium]
MKKSTSNIGSRLRQRRNELGWSLDRAAANTGVSKAMLGQIERGESSPTVGTLWKIVSGFKVSFSSLLEEGQDAARTAMFSADKRNLIADDDGIAAYTLIPFDPLMNFELMVVSLAANSTHVSTPHARGVVEHVIPLTAPVEIWVGGEWVNVAVDQVFRFSADQPHSYRNPNNEQVTFHNLIRYP